MKKNVLKTCLVSLASALTLGVGAFLMNQNVNVEKAEALSTNKHLYIKVTDVSEIQIGDVIVLASGSGRVFDYPAGNPRYMHVGDVSGMSSNRDRLFADESEVDRLEVCAGIETQAYSTSFSFKCLDVDGYNVQNKYLGWVDNEEIQPHDKGNTAYYYGNIAFRPNVDGYSSWSLENDGTDGEVRFYRINEPRPEEGWNIRVDTRTARPHLYYGNNGDKLRIFKEIDRNNFNSQDTYTYLTNEPNKSHYYQGDTVDLSGLEFNTRIDGRDLHIRYDEEPGFFSNISNALYDGRVTFDYCEITYNFACIDIMTNPVNFTFRDYVLQDELLYDVRGSYVLGARNEGNVDILMINALTDDVEENSASDTLYVVEYQYTDPDDPEGETATQVYDDYLHVVTNPKGNKASRLANTPVTIVSNPNNINKIHIYNPKGGNYLGCATSGAYEGHLRIENAPSDDNAITITANCEIEMDGKVLVSDGNVFKFVSNPTSEQKVRLYKKAIDNDFMSHIDAFVSSFFSRTNSDCANLSVQPSTWNNVINDFSSLTVDEKAYLVNITYIHNSNAGLENIYDAMDRYDYIVAKYGYSDFLSRKDFGTWQDNYNALEEQNNQSNNVMPIIMKNDGSLIVVVSLAAVVSIALVGFITYKKKHQ